MKSIQTKLILIFALVITIPMVVLGTITYLNASRSLQESVEASAYMTAVNTSELINQEFASVDRVLKFVQNNEAVRTFLQNNDPVEGEAAFKYIQEIKGNNEDLFEEVFLVNQAQKVVMNSESLELELDVSERAYMAQVMAGESAVSELLVSKASGANVVVVAEPIIVNGEVIGGVLGTVLFSNIEARINEIVIGEKGYAYLIDHTATLLVHPDAQMVEDGGSLLDQNNSELDVVIKEMIAGKSGQGFYTFDGVYKMVAYAPTGPWSLGVTANYDDYMSAAIRIRNMTLITLLVSIIIALSLAYVFSATLVRPIRRLQALMVQAGGGDLTVRNQMKTTSKDEVYELSKAFNQMMEEQSMIVGQVRSGSVELVAMAQDLAASSEELSAGSEETRAKAEQVADETTRQSEATLDVSQSLIELSSLVLMAKGKAETATVASDETKDIALSGSDKVKGIVAAMSKIDDKSTMVSQTIVDVEKISNRIAEITGAISGIADQTNLLALNATIEASRAGEHGKGFMVVAEEIRKLAEQTNNESSEIHKLTKGMIQNIELAVGSVKESQASVKEGVSIVGETDAFFKEIVKAVDKTGSNINDILDITENEVATSSVIVGLIDAVSTSSEENSRNVELISANVMEQSMALESISAASEETNAMAENLNGLVDRFKVDKEATDERRTYRQQRTAFGES